VSRRRGFTLIEVMIALTLSALVVLLAHRIFSGVLEGAERLGAARIDLDRESNARRSLTEMFGSLDIGTERAGGFAGHADRVEFTTWQRVPGGWLERRRVVLGVDDGILVARSDGAIPLQDSVSGVEFDYLLEPGANAAWVREWISPISAPVAVRLRVTSKRRATVDTLLFIVGLRG
jgi:prepilin-type N-terminal cleavage/methylation domain-containing protein